PKTIRHRRRLPPRHLHPRHHLLHPLPPSPTQLAPASFTRLSIPSFQAESAQRGISLPLPLLCALCASAFSFSSFLSRRLPPCPMWRNSSLTSSSSLPPSQTSPSYTTPETLAS